MSKPKIDLKYKILSSYILFRQTTSMADISVWNDDVYPFFNPKKERQQFKQKLKILKQASKKISAREKSQQQPLSTTQIRKLIEYEEQLEKEDMKEKDREITLYNQEMKICVKHGKN